jgi:hypothetical protein
MAASSASATVCDRLVCADVTDTVPAHHIGAWLASPQVQAHLDAATRDDVDGSRKCDTADSAPARISGDVFSESEYQSSALAAFAASSSHDDDEDEVDDEACTKKLD